MMSAGAAWITAVGVVVAGCTESGEQGDPPILIEVTVEPDPATLYAGSPDQADRTVQLVATLTWSDNRVDLSDPEVVWSSSDETVAEVDGSGRVTAAGPGAANVIATRAGVSGSAAITVLAWNGAVALELDPPEASLPAGTNLQLTATATLASGEVLDVTELATWSSSDSAVVAAGPAGLVEGLAAGEVETTATYEDLSASAAITVTAAELVRIDLSPINPTISQCGSPLQFTATGTYTDDGTADVSAEASWSTGDPGVATIDASGLATPVGPGTTIVSAAIGEVEGTTNLSVPGVFAISSPISVTVTPADPSLAVGEELALAATALFSDGCSRDVTLLAAWTSSDPAVAAVTSVGLLSGVGPGPATVTANFMGVTGTVTATVSAAE